MASVINDIIQCSVRQKLVETLCFRGVLYRSLTKQEDDDGDEKLCAKIVLVERQG